MKKNEYKEIIEDNGYISTESVIEFLREASISDIAVIAEIFDNGMSEFDYRALQEAIDEIEDKEE